MKHHNILSTINSCLNRFIISYNKLYGYLERLAIMYVPFISSLMYCIHTYMMKEGIKGSMFYKYNSDFSGHSLFWLFVVYARSKRMCKWYRMSIKLAALSHLLNIMYYEGILGADMFLDCTLAIFIASVLCWLIFRITYKTTKSIRSACKRLETE